MVSWLRARRSAITFDIGAAGIRVCQLRQRRTQLRLCDQLALDCPPAVAPEKRAEPPAPERPEAGPLSKPPAVPTLDPAQLERLIGRGSFAGRTVALVLSPPEVQFFPLRLPPAALGQPQDRLDQVLRLEVAQECRRAADDLEVRHWPLPIARPGQPNVIAVVMSSQTARQWCDLVAKQGLVLRRIEVSPTALVHLAQRMWVPADNDLWGVLDLGLRHSVLTVVVGQVPTYVRAMSTCAHDWTERLAGAFEVPYHVAEQLKREHGMKATERGVRRTASRGSLLQSGELQGAIAGVLQDSIQVLAQEAIRCFAYVMQSYPDVNLARVYLAGGGAAFAGLAPAMETCLGVRVLVLRGDGETDPRLPERAPVAMRFEPQVASALGAAMLDLEVACTTP